jgi:hypothetical protein
VATPSGGLHHWLAGPASSRIPNSAGTLAPAIDVRGSGGYLVGPGSRSRTGRYTLAPVSAPDIASVPDPLLALLTRTESPPVHRSGLPLLPDGIHAKRLTALLGVVLAAGEGELNNSLFWAACRSFEHARDHHLDTHAIAAALRDAAVHKGHPERGAEATITSAQRRILGSTA